MIASLLIAAARATDVFLSTLWPAEADRINALLANFDDDQPAAVAPEAAASPAGDDPPLASPTGPSLESWCRTALLEVLAENKYSASLSDDGWADWCDAVAPELIAVTINAIKTYPVDVDPLRVMRDADQRIAQQLETGHDMGLTHAAETFPQFNKVPK
jgi:hypothetical protein